MPMKVLVGSSALANYIELNREPKDLDYFTNLILPRQIDGKRVETFFHPELTRWFSTKRSVATPDELLTIKMSHIFWDLKNNSWDKHMYFIRLLQDKGFEFIPELYDILYPIWEERYGKKKVNLNQDPETFFNKQVNRVYEHDSIHESIAYGDTPLFNLILKDGAKVAVSKDKFDALDYETQLNLVREELYALALERLIIPSGYKYHPYAAYAQMLKAMVTRMSKGWFPLFIVANIGNLARPDVDYVQKFHSNKESLVKL